MAATPFDDQSTCKMTLTETTNRLRQLRTMEVIIGEMLCSGPLSSILKQKLYQLEDIVAELPDDSEEDLRVANDWRMKLAHWWKQCALLEEKPKVQQQILPQYSILSPPPLIEEDFFDDQLSREYLGRQLKSAFEELPDVTSAADLEAMKQLIALIVRAFELLPPSTPDVNLQTVVFEAAFSKLAAGMRNCFTVQFKPPYQLVSLFNYLRLEIDDYCENNKLLLPAQIPIRRCDKRCRAKNRDKTELKAQEKDTEDTGQNLHCRMCHEEGHQLENCPQMDAVFCFRCYNFAGHSSTRCTQPYTRPTKRCAK